MIVLAFTALIANVVLWIASALLVFGFQDYERRQLCKSNNDLKATDKHKKDYGNCLTGDGFHRLNHDLHTSLTASLAQTAVFGLLLILLAVNFRRGKGWARWATALVLLIIESAPFRLVGFGGDAPGLLRADTVLIGVTGLAVIVLLFVPESSRFFAAVRAERTGAGGGATNAAPMGLRGLFGPRVRPGVEPKARPSVKPDAVTSPRQPKAQAAKRPAAQAGKRPTAPAERPVEKRAKAKARTGTEVASSAQSAQSAQSAGSAQSAAKPSGAGSAKNRGKSRKGS